MSARVTALGGANRLTWKRTCNDRRGLIRCRAHSGAICPPGKNSSTPGETRVCFVSASVTRIGMPG